MSELAHICGSALQLSATGGIQLSSGPKQGQEKIIRRLLTSADDLLSDLSYGAGIPMLIGTPGNVDVITAIIRKQLQLESDVLQNPPPKVGIFNDPDTGLYIATIIYTDNTTLEQNQIKLPLSVAKTQTAVVLNVSPTDSIFTRSSLPITLRDGDTLLTRN